MTRTYSRTRGRSQKRKVHHNLDNKFPHLLSAERQPLEAISTPASLRGVLDGICNALDCQIGNVVSFISLRRNNANELADIAMKAELFGLHTFCSESVLAENDEQLGSLEMHCCDRRSPSASEFQSIERAACLAALAIQFQNESDHQGYCDIHGNRPVRGRVLEWPVSTS